MMQNISPHDESTGLPFKLIQYLTNKYTCFRVTHKGAFFNESDLQMNYYNYRLLVIKH